MCITRTGGPEDTGTLAIILGIIAGILLLGLLLLLLWKLLVTLHVRNRVQKLSPKNGRIRSRKIPVYGLRMPIYGSNLS